MFCSVTHFQGQPLLQQLQAILCTRAKQTPFPSVLGNPHRSWEACRSYITLTSLCANKSCPVHSKPQMFHIDPPVVLAGWNSHDCCPLSFFVTDWIRKQRRRKSLRVCLAPLCMSAGCSVTFQPEAKLACSLYLFLSLSPTLWLIMQSVS